MSLIVRPPLSGILAVAGAGGGSLPTANLQLWLKGDSISASEDDEISTWNDSSGNGRHVTGVVGTTLKPRYKATSGPNSTPCVLLYDRGGDNEGGYFTVPDFLTGYTAGHGFVVVKMNGVAGSDAPVFGDWGTAGDAYYAFSTANLFDDFGSTVRLNNFNPIVSIANWRLYESRSSAGTNGQQFYIDGTIRGDNGSANTVAFNSSPFIGRTASGSRLCGGMVAEVIFYNAIQGGADYTDIKSYIATKYALTIA